MLPWTITSILMAGCNQSLENSTEAPPPIVTPVPTFTPALPTITVTASNVDKVLTVTPSSKNITPTPRPPEPTPTVNVNYEVPIPIINIRSTSTNTVDSIPIIVSHFQEIQPMFGSDSGGPRGYSIVKVHVQRGDYTAWLPTTNQNTSYGCDVLGSNYDTFGCYWTENEFIDLNADGEPEISVFAYHDGSCGVNSFHFYQWQGEGYQLLSESKECGLEVEYRDLNNDSILEIITTESLGGHQLPTPWRDVYEYKEGKLTIADSKFPEIYEDLLKKYNELLPDYEDYAKSYQSDYDPANPDTWSYELKTLKEHMAMASSFVSGK